MYDIRVKRAKEWSELNPVLRNGEPGFDRTAGRLKIGNGETPWNDLSFFTSVAGSGSSDLPSYLEEESLRAAFVATVGTRAAPVTDPATARPDTEGVVYWLCANGVTPANAADGDLIWNAT